LKTVITAVALTLLLSACGDDDADALGIGAACDSSNECAEGQSCLTDFKGGYCGSVGCATNDDCPSGSACVVHTDGKRYCFRVCIDKPDCNVNRSVEVEANCSSSVTFASGKKEGKACIPPSG
jgi:hypothetical protein